VPDAGYGGVGAHESGETGGGWRDRHGGAGGVGSVNGNWGSNANNATANDYNNGLQHTRYGGGSGDGGANGVGGYRHHGSPRPNVSTTQGNYGYAKGLLSSPRLQPPTAPPAPEQPD
ncbi:unnamed protein product, partial [Ectocarpus sp. 13 AM-2016]